ncbi:MAG: helix-turn-helix domain-containing protein [Vulcanimicrobiota bacterium]
MGDIKRKRTKAPNDQNTSPTILTNPFLSVKQAQGFCGLRMETIRKAIQSGELKAKRFLSMTNGTPSQQSRYLVRASDLEQWLLARTIDA